MSLPYFPMYPTDFEAKTAHLTLAEDGAYNRLLRLCWMSPDCKIPADEAWIMRRCRAVTDEEKAAVKSVLSEFFTVSKQCYSNARLMREYSAANDAHEKRKNAGKKGSAAKLLKNNNSGGSNAKAMLQQPEPEPEPDISSSGGGSARDAVSQRDGGPAAAQARAVGQNDDPTFREKILTALGADPKSGLIGPNGKVLGTIADMAEVKGWQADLGLSEPEIMAQIHEIMAQKKGGDVKTFRYFTPAMQRLAGMKAAAPMQAISHEGGQNVQYRNDQSSGQPANRHGAVLTAGFAAVASRISSQA